MAGSLPQQGAFTLWQRSEFGRCRSAPSRCAAVGRVFTSGEPEMSHNVQRYDQHVYLRAAEAQVRRNAQALAVQSSS